MRFPNSGVLTTRPVFLYLSLLAGLLSFTGCPEEGGDEAVPSRMDVAMTALEVAEADYGSFIVEIPLQLDAPNEFIRASVAYAAEGVTAEAGSDFVGAPSRVSFPLGSTSAVARVRINSDLNLEENETFVVRFSDPENVELGTSEVTVTILNDDDTVNPFGIPQEGEDISSEHPGYTLLWADEFDDDGSFENWRHEIGSQNGGWGNNELQYYQPQNAIVGDGHLIITAREENINGFGYTSSRMITKDIFEFTYGRIDVRAALPEGQGIWPAIWMLGANISEVSWPQCGEIDIMEMLGHETKTLHGTVHFANGGGGHRFLGQDVHVEEGLNRRFNVFTVIWTEDYLEWRLNDVPYNRITRTQIGPTWPFDLPQFLLLNCAVGGRWPGNPDGSTVFPQKMFVDYVRVYQPE